MIFIFIFIFILYYINDIDININLISRRATIVFDGVPALLAGIESLVADPDVRVVRVKNRLDPAYAPRTTAGYRSPAAAAAAAKLNDC